MARETGWTARKSSSGIPASPTFRAPISMPSVPIVAVEEMAVRRSALWLGKLTVAVESGALTKVCALFRLYPGDQLRKMVRSPCLEVNPSNLAYTALGCRPIRTIPTRPVAHPANPLLPGKTRRGVARTWWLTVFRAASRLRAENPKALTCWPNIARGSKCRQRRYRLRSRRPIIELAPDAS